MQKAELRDLGESGRAWYDPNRDAIYAGSVGDYGTYMGQAGERYEGGILTDVQTIETKVVLEELLGLARPDYVLDQACTIVSTPELVLDVDTETIASGQANVKPLEESLVRNKSFARVHEECVLNEAHIVLEDRAMKKASHDLLRLNIADCAREIALMRNTAIATELMTATQDATDQDWGQMTTPPNSDHNPWTSITPYLSSIKCAGYPVDFIAVNPIGWGDFLGNSYVSSMVQAGIFDVKTPTITLPGWPSVKVLIDCSITDEHAIIGSKRATILCNGPTEAVQYRNEPKRYTGYIIRQYIVPDIVVAGAIEELTNMG